MSAARSAAGEAAPGEAVPAAYRLDQQVGFLLRQVQQRHTTIFAAAFGEEMTPLQWAALAKLAEVGACSQNHLGRLIATDVATIKGVIERLVRRGLVDTRADPGDRRRVLLRLTPTGQDAYAERVAVALGVSGSTLAPLDPDERAMLVRLLERMR